MKIKVKSLLSVLLAVVLLLSTIVGVVAEEGETVKTLTPAQQKQSIARLIGQMSTYYYYGITDEDLLYRALCSSIDNGSFDYDKAVESMMKLLKDGYSEFYSAERFQQLYTNITGEFYGIGVTITLSGNHVVVMSVFPDSPAEKSGILPYDLIVSVDGKDISGMSVSDVANLIKREKGKKVDVGIIREGVSITVSCFCDEVNQNPVSYEILEDGSIGYIYVSSFSMNLDEFIVPVLKEFEQKGISDIILDIRNNGGGEINAAISLANHFIPEGTIAKFKYKDESFNRDLVVENGMTKSPYNLVLLVNENSASASELFAGAVKGRNAGTIIGTTTYGKGSMQSIYSLVTGSAIKYTIAEFHSPTDERIHTVGVKPDFIVENTSYKVDESSFEKIEFNKVGNVEEGTHILAVEQRLEAMGYMDEADLVYDDETKDAIMYFQTIRGLDITGVPDAYTLVALNDIVYDFEIAEDDQIKAAVQYIKTGNIDEYISVMQ